MRFFKKATKGLKRGLDHATGKHQIKKQYRHGLEQSYALETEMKAKLYLQLCTEQSKIAEYRQTTQLFTQEETAQFLKEKTELPKLQAEKEAAFKEGCEKIENTMQIIRAALYACMTGNIDIVESLLRNTHTVKQVRNTFFKLYPLHIAAEYNQAKIIALLGSYGVNFTRLNNECDSAIDLAEVQGNVDAVEALRVLEQKTETLWLALEQGGREAMMGISKSVSAGADLNATNEHGDNVLTYIISKQYDLTTITWVIHLNTELNPTWSLEQTKEFINKIPNAQIRTLLLEYFVEIDQALFTVKNDNVLLNEGPKWSDIHGWQAPHYNSTIRSITAEVNGQNQLFVLGRGSAGIHLHSYDFITNSWITHPMGTPWSDHNGCAAAQYYSTIRLAVARVEGADQLFVLMRCGHGIDLWRYNPVNLTWTQQPSGTNWSDQNGCAGAQYYSTIRLAVANVEGTDQLFVLMRCGHGIDLWRYNPVNLKWTQQPSGTDCSDQNGYNVEAYYSTIRLVVGRVIVGQDRVDQLFVCMRASKGIDLWCYDPHNLAWTQQSVPDKNWFGPNGCAEMPFSTFTVTVGHSGGCDILYVFIRQAGNINVFCYITHARSWDIVHHDPMNNGQRSWPNTFYENTVQLLMVKGDNISPDNLVIFARSHTGIEAYMLASHRWITLPYNIPLINADGLNFAPYYQSIQSHAALINDQRRIMVLVRSSNGIQCWSSTINMRALRARLILGHTLTPFLSLTKEENHKALAFIETVSRASESLLSAAEHGNWVGIKESLNQGADINVVNEQGYNALQVAIVAKKLTLEILNGLIGAGIDFEHQTAQTIKTLGLANQHMPEITQLLSPEPVMGIHKYLSIAVGIVELKTSFQEHCERAQRFLDKYPDDTLKIQAILAYYLYLSKTEPYALYVMPTLLILSQLTKVIKKAEESLPDEMIKDFPQKQILEAAQLFFKRTRAIHCILNEIGTQAHTLSTEAEFMTFEWSYVVDSIQLKREAIVIAQSLKTNIHDKQVSEALFKSQRDLRLKGTTSVLEAFSKQVFGLDIVENTDLEKTAIELLKYQEEHDGALKTIIKQHMSKKVVEVVREAFDSGLIQLPAKQSLTQSLQLWEEGYQECKAKIEVAEIEFKLEREAIEKWLDQREVQYLERMEECKRRIQSIPEVEAGILVQYNAACLKLSKNFKRYRGDLKYNFEEAKDKAERNFMKSAIAIAAAAIFAPQFAPALASSLGATLGVAAGTSTMATLELIVEGVVTNAMSSAFTGNTKGMVKNAFIAGWTAGFGSVLGRVLEKSSTLTQMDELFSSSLKAGQHVVSTTVVKAIQTLPASFESGKLGASLFNTLGTALALGTSQELSFVEKLNTQFVSVLVSATVTSLVTRSDFLGNTISLGMNTLLQSAGAHLGKQIAAARAEQARQRLIEDSVDMKVAAEPSIIQEQEKVQVQWVPVRRYPAVQPVQAQERDYARGYHVPEHAMNAAGAQAYERFIERPRVSANQSKGASEKASLSKKPIYSVNNRRGTKNSNPILDFLFTPAYAEELFESNSSQPFEEPKTLDSRKFFESIGDRGETALSDDQLFVPGAAYCEIVNPLAQNFSYRLDRIIEEYQPGRRASSTLSTLGGRIGMASGPARFTSDIGSAFGLTAMGAGHAITSKGMQTGLATQPALQFSTARSARNGRGLGGSQGYTPYASAVKLMRNQGKARKGLSKTPDNYMREQLVKVPVKIYTTGDAGHLAFCVLVQDDTTQKLKTQTIGLYPDVEDKFPNYLAPLFISKGKIVFEKNDSHLSSKELITGSTWVTESEFLQLCENVEYTIQNPGNYALSNTIAPSCVGYTENSLNAIGRPIDFSTVFNVLDFIEMDNNWIKWPLALRFKELTDVVQFFNIISTQTTTEHSLTSGFKDYWVQGHTVVQNFKDANLRRGETINLTKHKP